MTRNQDEYEGHSNNQHSDEYENRPEIVLGGLSRIMKTSLLMPLDVVQVRLRYPDTWCVKMFRIMVNCKGCPGPYEVLTAAFLQKRTYDALRWGIFYCLYNAHIRTCKKKGYEPLCNSTYLLTGRDIVWHAVKIGQPVEVLDYVYERRRQKESKVLKEWLAGLTSFLHSAAHAAMRQDWSLDALGAA